MSMSDDPRAVSPPSDAELWRSARQMAFNDVARREQGIMPLRPIEALMADAEKLADYYVNGPQPPLAPAEGGDEPGDE